MSAILGFFDPRQRYSPSQKEDFLCAMQASLMHRAPDGFNTRSSKDASALLSHGRHIPSLNIVQPISSEDGQFLLAYDGEIYNLQDLLSIQPIKDEATHFIRLLQSEMPFCLEKIDGSFAFAMYGNGGSLVLAVDMFGDKPLYWLEHNGIIAFASELVALQTLPFFDPMIDEGALGEFLGFQYIGAPRTLYPQVKKIPAGHWLLCKPGLEPSIHRYRAFTPGLMSDPRPLPELAEELESLLLQSLKRRCAGKTSVAACLSGGMDSSTVAALACAHLGIDVHTFTIGFPDNGSSEHEQARLFADVMGSTHHERILEPKVCDFLLKSGTLMDEPNGDSSCMPTYMLSAMIREHSRFTLCGDCADELFAGYARYSCAIQADRQHIPFGQFYYVNFMLFFPPSHLESLLGYLPEGYLQRFENVCGDMNSAQWIHPLHRMRKSDLENYTPGAPGPKVERMGMRHGLEYCSPFMSTELMRFAEGLPPEKLMDGNTGKLLLRQVAYKYLPRAAIDAPKRGFCIPAEHSWKKNILATAQTLLAGSDSRLRRFIGEHNSDRFLKEQNKSFNIHQVWTVCVLESYLRARKSNLPEPHRKTKQHVPHLSVNVLTDNAALKQAMIQAKVNVSFHEYYSYETALFFPLPNVTCVVCVKPFSSLPENAVIFEWNKNNNWESLRTQLPPNPVAVFADLGMPSLAIRKHMAEAGIMEVFVQKDKKFILFTIS